ncbi:RES family NAD+ phosphorylase [uncultured Deinococcus sp.]|uniref:RES family NAD+ phosphorylase n=1 Tax=uncultured Deinococcus sp. TaxID=158789 RepID=UPI0025D74FF2|nr:RES family NAD+ phosphorylase [uncultured Deinococcus sp.]
MGSLYPLEHLQTPVSGIGALHASGRFNVKGDHEHRVTYLAEHPHVSMREFRYTTASAQENAPDHEPAVAVPPVVIFSVTFNLTRVLDLTDQRIRGRIELKMTELTGHWWLDNYEGEEAVTQVLSRFAFNTERFDAIKYESARIGTTGRSAINRTCYAVFPDRLQKPAFLSVEPSKAGIPEGATYVIP